MQKPYLNTIMKAMKVKEEEVEEEEVKEEEVEVRSVKVRSGESIEQWRGGSNVSPKGGKSSEAPHYLSHPNLIQNAEFTLLAGRAGRR